MKTIPVILTVIVCAIVFGGGGYWLGKNRSSNNCPLANRCSNDLLTATSTASAPIAVAVSSTAVPATTTPSEVTQAEAVAKVKDLQEVKDYLARVPSGQVQFDHDDVVANTWVIQVFSMGADASATFNWFNVNKKTGEITAMF